MQAISPEDIIRRLCFENPWWKQRTPRDWEPRAYFDLFFPLVNQREPRRAVVLMGPRGVGKTVMIHHAIQKLIVEGAPPKSICYISVDHPIYTGLSLDKLLGYYAEATEVNRKSEPLYVVFDEIQYLKNWEVHLKVMVDAYPNIKVIASGSAAAALRMKSNASGGNSFVEFLLPPLTFYEYLELRGQTGLVDTDITRLNQEFLRYLNYGGFPESKGDAVESLRTDLPSLYGIGDTQELNRVFATLALNTAGEVSLGELSQNSGVAKNTIKRYIEYLEAAFLIKCIHRVDRNAKRFRRANFFKVYLTNPSMRSALFTPLEADDKALGAMVETTFFAQWFHSPETMHYARWQDGEVDMVRLKENQKPGLVVEVKWSDRYCDKPEELRSLLVFCQTNGVQHALVSSISKVATRQVGDVKLSFLPASIHCYAVGYNLIHHPKNV